jgi:hypothetical protein
MATRKAKPASRNHRNDDDGLTMRLIDLLERALDEAVVARSGATGKRRQADKLHRLTREAHVAATALLNLRKTR